MLFNIADTDILIAYEINNSAFHMTTEIRYIPISPQKYGIPLFLLLADYDNENMTVNLPQKKTSRTLMEGIESNQKFETRCQLKLIQVSLTLLQPLC
jgi:hypothetical protein